MAFHISNDVENTMHVMHVENLLSGQLMHQFRKSGFPVTRQPFTCGFIGDERLINRPGRYAPAVDHD